jgi:hypothetical protein
MWKSTGYSLLVGAGCLVTVYAPTFVLVSLLMGSGVIGTFQKSKAQLTIRG